MEENSIQFSEIYPEMTAESIQQAIHIPVGRDYGLKIYDEKVEKTNP